MMTSKNLAYDVLPLESLRLAAIPVATHNLAWSPDAELAVGSDDSVFLYVPEFTSPDKAATGTRNGQGTWESRRQYHGAALRFPVVEVRRPELNEPLFRAVGQDMPFFEPTPGAGQTVVANIGSSMNHVVALEWSPSGLGYGGRSVLAVLTGGGTLHVYCEGPVDLTCSRKLKGTGRRKLRTINSWSVAWGVGENLILPRGGKHHAPFSREYITSFAWAVDPDGGALLAYANDENEAVIISVQSRHGVPGKTGGAGWRVEEVDRFTTAGPHHQDDATDPDACPSGSSFSLRWSPWLKRTGTKVAILSYMAKNYVGFRNVIIRGSWKQEMATPDVRTDPQDCAGLCLYLGPDAFLVWEDLIWTIQQSKVCRAVIATPAKVQSIEVAFDGTVSPALAEAHTTEHCGTTYPPEDEMAQAVNPITGLTVHTPNLSHSTPDPYFSLVRLSATPNNSDWYQSNLPLPSNPGNPNPKPGWAAVIAALTEITQPVVLAYRPTNPDGDKSDAETDSDDRDDTSDEGEAVEDDESDVESFDKKRFLEEMRYLEDMERIPTTRVRIWGMTNSPGGGVTAVFVSLHNTIKSDRTTLSGLRCSLLFGRNLAPVDQALAAIKKLTTEGRMWEWMYGGGRPVPGASAPGTAKAKVHLKAPFKVTFKDVASAQVCVFCGGALQLKGQLSRCRHGHEFENCAATGIPILAPDITNRCGVCGMNCLKPSALAKLAPGMARYIAKKVSDQECGGCGGKFIG